MIPVLKKETEIKKEPNGAIIINPEENKHRSFRQPKPLFSPFSMERKPWRIMLIYLVKLKILQKKRKS